MKVDRKRIVARIKKFGPLIISMGVALLFALANVVIESETFTSGLLSKNGLVHLLDLKALDVKYQGHKPKELPEPKVVVAAVDEKGIERYGLWPWSRGVVAQFIRKATLGGAKVIAFDAAFADEDRNASWVTLKRFAQAFDEAGLSASSPVTRELRGRLRAASTAYDEAKREGDDGDAKNRVQARAATNRRKSLDLATTELKRADQALTAAELRSAKFSEMLHAEIDAASPDDALAAAIAASPQTILGFIGFTSESELAGVKDKRVKEGFRLLSASAIDSVYDYREQEIGTQTVSAIEKVNDVRIEDLNIGAMQAVLPPLNKFARAARSFAYFNASPDRDGQMRHVQLLQRHGDKLYPALATAAAARFFDANIYPLKNPFDPHKLYGVAPFSPNEAPVPTDFTTRLILNYYNDPQKYFPTYSVADFIDETVPNNAYRGKIVLFGYTAQGWLDLKSTPFSAGTPGVYIHATAMQNMIDGLYLERFFGMALVEAIAYLLIGLLLGLLLPRLPAWAGFLITAACAVGLYYLDLKLVFPRGVWLMNVLPTLQLFLTFVGITIYGFLTLGREKRMIRRAFQFYLSKSVVEEVLKDPGKLKLGGQKVNATVLFSDVRGFTTISEKLSPEALVSLLNSYLTPMTDIVLKYEGTLDKYIGDAIMAIFGAPVAYTDNPTRACRVSLEMMQQLQVLREVWRAQGLPDINIGVGINTGGMSAGNMGSLQRFDYTVMGDNVNLASRLESINKQYGTNIIVSEFTYDAAKNDIYGREIDLVRVKGKREPVKIYELLGLGTPEQAHADLIGEFARAISLYRGQKWDEAVTAFELVRQKVKLQDPTSTMYIERCEKMRGSPPGADWDGVCTMTTK